MTKINKTLLVMTLAFTAVLASCSKSDATVKPSQESEAQVSEVKAPTKVEAITKVQTKATAKADDTSAFELPTEDQVVRGGTFTISNGTEPESLDPALIQGEPEHRLNYALFEGLVENDPKTANAIPGIAKSWEFSDDNTIITFHLRESKWSDGVDLTANDFLYSWERELDPATGAPYAWFPEMFIKGAAEYANGEVGEEGLGVKVLDDYTLQVTLVGPLPYAISAFAHYSFAVVPQHIIKKYGDEWTQEGKMVSNGPFVLEDHVSQSYISCVKNENYWDAENVYLDKVVFLASDDANTNYNMYIDGELDWLPSVSTEQIESAKMRNDYQVGPQLATAFYTINCIDPALKSPLVRQALSYAVDRDSMVENLLGGGQIPAWGMVPEMAGYDAMEFPFDDYDEAKDMAREKMAEAGYPNGIGFPKITLLYNSNESNRKIAELLQSNFKEVLGIQCDLENQEWGTFLSNRNAGQFQLARAGWVGDYQDPNTFLDMFVSGAAMNGGNFNNADYDALIKKAATMPNGPDRFEVLHQAENILIEEEAVIPFYYYASSELINTEKWGGWFINTMDYHPVKSIYLKSSYTK